MQGGRGGRHGVFGFGDPFAGFAGFGRPGSLMSGFFSGANPFDDPFFTNPFGSMMQPSLLGPSMFGPQRVLNGGMSNADMFGSFMFGPQRVLNGGMSNADMFGSFMFGPQIDLSQGMSNAGGFIQQPPEPSRPKGPIIKELSSDDEDDADGNKDNEKKKDNIRKHPRTSKEPYVEDPDEAGEDNKRPKHGHFGREFNRASTLHPQPQTFMFQSSTVTYGGPNGACYTSSTTRRTGGDGITLEESKKADTTTGKATHRVSRGIGDKGHSLTRKLNSDGHVNTLQTLHNLDEDELAGFEETWQRNARENLPGWDPRMNMLGNGGVRPNIWDVNQTFALPAPDQSCGSNSSRNTRNGSSKGHSGRE